MVSFYCENGTLGAYLERNSLIYEEKIFILFQITRGLLEIHNAGKIHKDLHSGNILLNKDGYLFICDFVLQNIFLIFNICNDDYNQPFYGKVHKDI